jgi:hypothetical protein
MKTTKPAQAAKPERQGPQYCEAPYKKFKLILAHVMCHCLLVTQFVLPTQSLAQESNSQAPIANSNSSTALTAEEANNQRDANQAHENQAAIQGGLNGTCSTHDEVVDTDYERYQLMNEEWKEYTQNQTDALNGAIGNLAANLGTQVNDDGTVGAATGGPNLLEAQAAYSSTYGVSYPEDANPAQIAAYEAAKDDYIQKADTKREADARYDRARRARNQCFGRDTNCPTSVIQEFNEASAAKQRADNQYNTAYNQYRAKRDALAGNDGNGAINDVEDPFFAKEKRYEDARRNLSVVQDELRIAEQELQLAQNACNNLCTPAERNRLNEAQSNLASARQNVRDADAEYRAARSAYRNAPRGMANDSQQAVNNMSGEANAMTASHQISGCAPIDAASAGTHDITQNTSDQCALGGPLFDADEEVKRIARAGIQEAREMAARRADMLFDMELQKEFAQDYQLYQLAVNGAYVGTDRVEENYEEIDALDNTDQRKTKNLQLAISNIKTVGAASAIVKDMVCEQHDRSEVDSKSYHILRAAGATWMMAVVNDTSYYSSNSACFSDVNDEQLAGDKNNEQIQSVERAALLHDQQLESMCLRIVPEPPPADYQPNNPDHYKIYGNTPEEAARYVAVLTGYTDGEYSYPPLAERCAEYYEKIRGEDYKDKPKTREYARDMVAEALNLAVEELAAKRQKIATAYANVLKGRAWVKRVESNIRTMLALAAVIFAAYLVMRSICPTPGGGWACGIASALNSKYVYITGTVVAVWLMMELARAKKFLAKWEARLEQAKFFHHMACNFEDAKAEENLMAEMGDRAKAQKDLEIENARRRRINEINNAVDDAVRTQLNGGGTPADTQSQTYIPPKQAQEIYVSSMNAGLDLVKNERGLIGLFSSISEELNSKEKIKAHLRTLGLELMEVVLPTANAADNMREERRNQSRTASSLNITEGTESFRYFLVQRNQQYQNLTNDITNQPEHSPDDSEISPASGNVKNINNAEIRSVHDLAAPYTGGSGGDPLDGLTELEKLGMPTPETRVATIMALLELFNDNITKLNGGIAEIAFQRDQYVQLLDQMRRRMKINKTGLGNTQLIPNAAPTPVCMVGDVSQLKFDSTCGCSASQSCTSFEYPKFTPTTPDALKNGGKLSVSTTNSVLSGNLSGAALDGGKLSANRSAVRSDLMLNGLGNGNGSATTGSGANTALGGGGAGSSAIDQASEANVSRNLANLGVNPNSGSAFSRVRNSLLNSGAQGTTDGEKLSDADKKAQEEAERRRRARLAAARAAGAAKNANGASNKKISEDFSLTDGNGNLDLAGLTDEERARLGLAGAGAIGDGKEIGNRDDRYAHVRNLSADSGRSKANKDDPYYGINKNRKKSLWNIISKRYEKTAFPVFLTP